MSSPMMSEPIRSTSSHCRWLGHTREHMRSHARRLNPPRARVLNIAGRDLSSTTVMRPPALQSKWTRFLGTYGYTGFRTGPSLLDARRRLPLPGHNQFLPITGLHANHPTIPSSGKTRSATRSSVTSDSLDVLQTGIQNTLAIAMAPSRLPYAQSSVPWYAQTDEFQGRNPTEPGQNVRTRINSRAIFMSDPLTWAIVGRIVERSLIVIGGILAIWFGFRLFDKISKENSTARLEGAGITFEADRMGPGVFFRCSVHYCWATHYSAK